LVSVQVFVVVGCDRVVGVVGVRSILSLVPRVETTIRSGVRDRGSSRDLLNSSLADGAPRDSAHQVTVLESDLNWSGKLVNLVDSGQPEGVGVGKVVAGSSSVALDEGSGPVGLQTRAWGSQVLSSAVTADTGVHDEGVTDPHWDVIPAGGALGHVDGLAVESHDRGLGLADDTPRDVLLNITSVDVGHGHWDLSAGRQPVREVVPRSKIALLVEGAEHEGHGAKVPQARAGTAKVLAVGLSVALSVQETVAFP